MVVVAVVGAGVDGEVIGEGTVDVFIVLCWVVAVAVVVTSVTSVTVVVVVVAGLR